MKKCDKKLLDKLRKIIIEHLVELITEMVLNVIYGKRIN